MECSEFRAFFLAFSQSPTIPPTEDRGLWLRDCHSTSNPGPFGTEAAREKALVKSGHVTPQILDIFVTWPYYGYASTGGELIEVTEYFLNYLSKYIARDTNQDRKINVFMSFFYFRWDHVL